jgi:hypothetical protein
MAPLSVVHDIHALDALFVLVDHVAVYELAVLGNAFFVTGGGPPACLHTRARRAGVPDSGRLGGDAEHSTDCEREDEDCRDGELSTESERCEHVVLLIDVRMMYRFW